MNPMRWMRAFTQSPDGLLHLPTTDLSDDVQKVNDTIGVMQSATALITTFSARTQAAVDAALDNGATAAELTPLTDLIAAMDAEKANLAAAVAANP